MPEKKPSLNYTKHYMCRLDELQAFVKILDGMKSEDLRRLSEQVDEAMGTPQSPKDWTNPAQWIKQMKGEGALTDATAVAATRIADGGLNPRHFNYAYMRVAVRHGFLEEQAGVLHLTAAGKAFVAGEPAAVDQFLHEEGCMAILAMIHDNNGAQLKDVLPLWENWLHVEADKDVHAESVLLDSIKTRLRYILVPLGLIQQEGIPRKYSLTDKGAKKYQDWTIGSTDKAEETKHTLAIRNLLDVGRSLGYQVEKEPSLLTLMPKQKLPILKAKVFNKKVDAVWKTNLPLVGEIRIAAEVQASGGIPDLLSRLKIVAPQCHYMIIVSDEAQILEIRDFIIAQGEEKVFGDKVIYLTFEELTEIRTQATNISSKLRPSFGDEDAANASGVD
jgi:hypothetical protein